VTPSPDASHADLWGAVDEATIWRAWPGECVVFRPRRGETHLVSALAASVMRCLLRTPATVDDLMEEGLRSDSADGSSRCTKEEIRKALSSLASRGLVARGLPSAPINESDYHAD
jgi:PqqD family protein of HPr-rel-A system